MEGFSDPARPDCGQAPVASEGSFRETRMPEDLGLLSDVPIGMLIFGGFIVAIFVSVFATVIVKGAGQWRRNNASPVVTAMARVVTKRAEVSGGTGESGAHTSHFATFEMPTGERCELALPAREFGLIADGDTGQLTYQGTRFKGFVRPRIASR